MVMHAVKSKSKKMNYWVGRKWQRSKIETLPASPQIHKKLIKIWNNSCEATSRWQQKIPGIQGDRLSSLKSEHRHKSPLTRKQHKPLDQPFPPRVGAGGGRRNTTFKPGKRRPQVEQGRKKMMKRQINTAQMKEQGRNLQDLITERK